MGRGQAGNDGREGVFFYPWERKLDRLVTPFEEFIHRQTTSGLILLSVSVVAVLLANSSLRDVYLHLTHAPVAFRIGGVALEMSWLHFVNEGLMVFFFFVVGLEIKREIRVGELSEPRKALLPILAALGGDPSGLGVASLGREPASPAGVGFLGGIGFTMSIFIAELSFPGNREALGIAKSGIMLASLLSAIAGYLWLRFLCPKPILARESG